MKCKTEGSPGVGVAPGVSGELRCRRIHHTLPYNTTPMKKILLCIDGSEYARSCCGYAAWMSRHTGAEVDVLHVSEIWQFETPLIADFGGSLGAQPYLALTSQLQEIEAQKAKMIKEAAGHIFTEFGLPERVRFHHRTGVLVDALEEFESRENPADLVVIGKRGESADFARGHLGSNMERVVRAAYQPVLVANRAYAEPTKALLAYDASPSARVALSWLLDSPAMKSVPVHVVTVSKSGEEREAADRLAEAGKILAAHPAGVVTQVLAGAPGDAIEQYVSGNGINFLLMGAYGHSAIRRFIIGSATSELVRRCKVPVLLFR